LLAVVLLGAVGTAAALSISASDVPEEAEVGSEVESRFTIDDAYTENSQWTLRLETELQNVSWVVEEYDQGDRVNQWTGGGQTFEQDLSSNPTGDEIRIQVRGDVPGVDSYNYSAPENFTVVALRSQTGDNVQTLETYEVHHFTTDSKEARGEIDSAEQAIENAGGNADAREDLRSAVSFYNSGQFEEAVREANNAEDKATQAQQSQQTNQMLIFGGLGVALLAIVVGGVWYWRNQQDDYDKLR
jgi:hypothetical protein